MSENEKKKALRSSRSLKKISWSISIGVDKNMEFHERDSTRRSKGRKSSEKWRIGAGAGRLSRTSPSRFRGERTPRGREDKRRRHGS